MIVISDDGVRRSSQAFSKRCGPIHLARLSKVAVVSQPTRRLRGIILNDVTNEDAGIEPDHPRPAMARSICSSVTGLAGGGTMPLRRVTGAEAGTSFTRPSSPRGGTHWYSPGRGR